MNIRSAKSKGRRLAILVKQKFLEWAPFLTVDDIHVTTCSVSGEDILLSPEAQKIYPYSIECKNRENINIWQAIKQAEGYAEKSGRIPLVVFSRNRHPVYVALEFDDFLHLTRPESKADGPEPTTL